MRRLARQGCHSFGLIVPHVSPAPKPGEIEFPYHETFLQVIREEGLATRPDWISDLADSRGDYEAYGYLQFQKIWKQRKRPDSLLVFPDTTVRGVITGVLKLGVETISSQMKFVFHRNAHMNLLCPFPVTWGISDEDVLAAKLIQIIERQFRGGEGPSHPAALRDEGGRRRPVALARDSGFSSGPDRRLGRDRRPFVGHQHVEGMIGIDGEMPRLFRIVEDADRVADRQWVGSWGRTAGVRPKIPTPCAVVKRKTR